jgi:hypothetical protein
MHETDEPDPSMRWDQEERHRLRINSWGQRAAVTTFLTTVRHMQSLG